MPQIVELPDGSEAEFPDGMSREAILGVVRRKTRRGPGPSVAELNSPEFSTPRLPEGALAEAQAVNRNTQEVMAKNAKPASEPPSKLLSMGLEAARQGSRILGGSAIAGQPMEPMLPSPNDFRRFREKLSPIIGPTELQAEAAAQGGMPQPEGLIPSLSKPIIPAPRIPQQEGTVAQVGAGAANALIGAAEFFESPLGVATFGTAFAPKLAQRAIGAAFTADMASHLPQQGKEAGRLSVEGTPQEKAEAFTGLGLTSAMAAAPLAHEVVGGRRAALASEAEARARPIELNQTEALPPRRPGDVVVVPREPLAPEVKSAPEPVPAPKQAVPAEIVELTKADPEIAKVEEALKREVVPIEDVDAIEAQLDKRGVKAISEEIQPKPQGEPNALPKQAADEGVLRPEVTQPEVKVELPRVDERNAQPEVAPAGAAVEQGRVSGKAEEVAAQSDFFTQLLDKGIEATKFDPKNLKEGVTGAPLWMTKAAVNGTLRVIKVTYEATKDAAKAIQNALVWLRSQNIKDFNESEARAFLEASLKEPKAEKPPGAIIPPPLPEGTGANVGDVRMRAISQRGSNMEEFPPEVRKKIEEDPNSFYRQQKMAIAAEEVAAMPDVQLAQMDIKDNRYTAAKVELINRLNAAGRYEESRGIIAEVAPELTRSGQIINLAKLFNALKPEQVVDLVNDNLTKNNRDPLKPEVAEDLKNKSQERITKKAVFDKRANEWKNDPSENNAVKVDKAAEEWRNAALEEQKLRLRLEYRSGLDIFKTLIQGNLLSPISFVYNLAGNTTFLPFNVAARYGGNFIGAIDSAISKRPRMDKVAPLKEAVSYLEGAIKGSKSVSDILTKGSQDINMGDTRPGLHPLEAMAKLMSKENVPTKDGRVPLAEYLKLAVEAAPFSMTAEASLRMLAAGDAPFRQAARSRIIESAAELEGIPKEQRAFAQKFPELVFNNETYRKIMDDTDAAVFQADSSTVNQFNRWIRSKGPIADVISTIIAPYKLTPLNIAKQLASFDPAFGLAMGALKLKEGDRRTAHRYLASAVIGSMLYGVSEWLYKKGLIFPALDTQDEEQKARLISEDVSNRINISGLQRAFKGEDTSWKPGDETVDFFRVGGPLGVSMYIIANANREVEKSNTTKRDSTMSVYGLGILQRMSFTLTQSFLKNATEVLNALKDKKFDRVLDSAASTVSASFLPNTSAAIARATRDYKVDVNDKEFTDRVEKMLRSKLGWAGLDDYMTLKRGLFGEPLRETPEGSNAFFYQFFDVTKGRQVTDDPLKLELYRLWRKSAEGKVLPEPPSDKTIVRNKKKYEITRDQASDLAEMVGKNRKQIADRLIENPQFRQADDEIKIRLLSRAWDFGSRIGRAQFAAKYGAELPEVQKRSGFEVKQ